LQCYVNTVCCIAGRQLVEELKLKWRHVFVRVTDVGTEVGAGRAHALTVPHTHYWNIDGINSCGPTECLEVSFCILALHVQFISSNG
jgi:hypothetical protein